MTAADLEELDLAYAPPYSSAKDPVNMAGYVIENVRSGLVKQFHWHDIEEIAKGDDALFLDVRTDEEYRRDGHLPQMTLHFLWISCVKTSIASILKRKSTSTAIPDCGAISPAVSSPPAASTVTTLPEASACTCRFPATAATILHRATRVVS